MHDACDNSILNYAAKNRDLKNALVFLRKLNHYSISTMTF